MIKENLVHVRGRIRAAAACAGKPESDISLVAVSKYFPSKAVSTALECGVTVFGESRVQEALAKEAVVRGKAAFHLIGNLQTNKAKKAVEIFDMIQSLDRPDLARALDRHARDRGKIQDCLAEIKISNEAAKHGIRPEELEGFLRLAADWPNIRIRGLMAMAPYDEDPEKARPFFSAMKRIFNEIKELKIPGIEMDILSMGMSGDFETAIEAGATLVRIGGALFEGLPKSAMAVAEEDEA